MKVFEIFYLIVEPFFPALYKQVRIRLRKLTRISTRQLKILDVGGRKSHYTIGLPAEIIISDLPKESDIQKRLNLGINESIINQTLRRRSNIKEIILDDMVNSKLPDDEFDGVIAIEVIEHIEEDENFLDNIYRVLKPEGFLLLTTPNGDSIVNTNPDHKRHYLKKQLEKILNKKFEINELIYIVKNTKSRKIGLYSWSLKNPVKTIRSMYSNIISRSESNKTGLELNPDRTSNILALVYKPKGF